MPRPISSKETVFSPRSALEAKAGLSVDMGQHVLFDRTENGRTIPVLHLDTNRIAEAQERRCRGARLDDLDHALLGDTGVADASQRDRAPRATFVVAV